MKFVLSTIYSFAVTFGLLYTPCEVGVEDMERARDWKGGGAADERRANNAARMREQRGNKHTQRDTPIEICWIDALRIEKEREKCKKDFKHFYTSCLARDVRNRKTGKIEREWLGKFHDLFIDFLSLDLNDVKTHSTLPKYLPKRDKYGNFNERWLYFRTLDSKPVIQDGADGIVSTMFYASFWQGVTIRICGDGLTKCALAPRGHLKSTIGGVSERTWRIIKNPEDRNVIQCVTSDRAKVFMAGIADNFKRNAKFMDLFGGLTPRKRIEQDNTEKFQVNCYNRRGLDPTVNAMGMESDATGSHGDHYGLDDVIGRSNSTTPSLRAQARADVMKLQAQRDLNSSMTNIGTRWAEDDPHVMFVGKPGNGDSGCLAQDTCFFVATVLDGDESQKVSTRLTPLGYGKPIWSEHWTQRTVEAYRRTMPEDWFWFGQYFNQFTGTSNRVFNRAWITRIPKEYDHFSMPDIARRLKLNIFMGGDTASGKADQKGKLDRSACLVLGQTKDRRTCYVLDGFAEKLPAELIAKGFVDLAQKWYYVAKDYGGMFRCGFEETAYTNFLKIVIDEELKKRGGQLFAVEGLKHNNRVKAERIRILAQPYSESRILWPTRLVVKAVNSTTEPYDFIKELEEEWAPYNPNATSDDIMDAHAYAYELALPIEWNNTTKPEVANVIHPGVYSRVAQEGTPQLSMGEYGG